MGSPKARLPYPEPDGSESTFLAHLVKVFQASRAAPVVAVLGHDAEALARDTELGTARVIVNSNYRDGMLTSIQAGIEAVRGEPVDGALVCPVDHPDIEPVVVDQLIARYEAEWSPIILPTYRGRRGHPVLFSRDVFSELLAAPASVGARQVVWDHEHELVEVDVAGKGVTIDIDTPRDYRDFRADAE